MDASAFSLRRLPSPQRRTPRSPLSPASCVDVQWTFLPPRSPHGHNAAAHTSARLIDRYDNAEARAELHAEQMRHRAAQDAAAAHEQRVLYDLMGETQRQAMLDSVMAEMEAMALVPVKRLTRPRRRRQSGQHEEPSPMATRRSSVLSSTVAKRSVELLPQRKLSVLGAKRFDGVEPVDGHAQDESDGSASDSEHDVDDDDDDDKEEEVVNGGRGVDHIPELRAIRDRQQRRSHRQSVGAPSRPLDTHIRWQKSAHVSVAMDLPAALLQATDSDEHEEEEEDGLSMEHGPLADMFPLSEEAIRERERSRSKKFHPLNRSPPTPPNKTTEPPLHHPPLNFAQSPRAPRVRKAPYGSWYVPREEWWPLHQTQQDTLAELFPEEQPTVVERHQCERESPNQHSRHQLPPRQPTLPHAWPSVLRAPSPRASPRVMPLVRPPTTVSSPRPTSPRVSQPHRASSSFSASCTAPPATASRVLPSRGLDASPRNSLPSSPIRRATKKASTTATAPDTIALRAAVLQKEIPQAYIAREYHHYLVSTGARVPSYLNL